MSAMGKATIVKNLKKSILSGDVMPYYQPIINAQSGKVAAVEALARWRWGGNFISPSVFIPACESTGYIGAFNTYLIDKIFEGYTLLGLQNRGILLSMNLTSLELSGSLYEDTLLYNCQKYGVDPTLVQLEVVETDFIDTIEEVALKLSRFQKQGFNIALDDFGKSQSCFARLIHLPLNTLKIDRYFVSSLQGNPKALLVLRGILALAKSMGLYTVVEGVETQIQSRLVTQLGSTYIQGFFHYKPLSVAQLQQVLM